MVQARRTFEILASTAVPVVEEVTLLGSGSAGTLGAKRILTHPDTVNFVPLVYWGNPEFTLGIDNEVLNTVEGSTVKTEGTTKVIRHEVFESDIIITERWPGSGKRLAMPTYFARFLYEIAANPPAFNAITQPYITWQPRDKNAKTYDIEIIDFTIGGDDSGIDFSEARGAEGNEILGDLEGLDTSPTGGIRAEVVLRFKIVGETA